MENLIVIGKRGALQLVKPTLVTRIKQAVVIATGTALAIHANAASSIDATGLTDEIDGGKATIIALFGTALVILGIFAGWRYLKRGANSA
jgi:hypothetical protein